MITAAAFLYFAQVGCDIVVLEVGLGGRLDSTNIIKTPLVSVITSVSMDHMNVLGNTIEEIAAEKCGIVKRGGITVAYPEQDRRVFNILYHTAILQSNVLITQNMGDVRIEAERITGTDIVYNGLHIHIPLIGAHQVGNCMTAVLAAEALRSRGMRRITGRLSAALRECAFRRGWRCFKRSRLCCSTAAIMKMGCKGLRRLYANSFPAGG